MMCNQSMYKIRQKALYVLMHRNHEVSHVEIVTCVHVFVPSLFNKVIIMHENETQLCEFS